MENVKKRGMKMSDKELDDLILGNVNKAIDESIKEIMEKENLSASRVMEDYRLPLKKALLVARREI